MRDFRDAKAMARTLRASLASKGLKISVAESLELTAELFGLADWNTLAAAIRRGPPASDTASAQPPRASIKWPSGFTRELDLQLWTGLSLTPKRESTSLRRWSISCLRCWTIRMPRK